MSLTDERCRARRVVCRWVAHTFVRGAHTRHVSAHTPSALDGGYSSPCNHDCVEPAQLTPYTEEQYIWMANSQFPSFPLAGRSSPC